ncbi:MAG: hypothetical protein H8E18_00480 [FCB group bacterium]|nr:hypothetical protein [FCB group bacterium]
MKITIKHILILLVLVQVSFAQTNSFNQNSKWLNIGIGIDPNTVHLNISANYSYPNRLILVQYKNGNSISTYSPIQPGTYVKGFGLTEYQSLGAAYGVISKWKYAYSSIALGPVFISSKGNRLHRNPEWSALGAMVEAQLFLTPFAQFGIGCSIGHYHFSETSFSSLSVGIQLGDLR